jgi:hypothetical protein
VVRAPAAFVGSAIDAVTLVMGWAAPTTYPANCAEGSDVVETPTFCPPDPGFVIPLRTTCTAVLAGIDFPKPMKHVTVVPLAPPQVPTSSPPAMTDESE